MKLAAAVLLLVATALAHAGTVTYVYTDPQGTPLAEADASGNITATFDYKPYGSQALGSSKAGPGYTGHVNDPDTVFVYMQARYYDPVVGRFLSVDPVSLSDGKFSRYAYASDSPVNRIDPDGRSDFIFGDCSKNPNCYGSGGDRPGSGSSLGSNKGGKSAGQSGISWADKLKGVYKGISNGLCELPIIGCNRENDPLTPDNSDEYQGMMVGGTIYRVAELAATDGESIELRASDIGIVGRVSEFRGSFSMSGDVATIRVDMIRGSIRNPFQIVDNMANLARSQGASTLKIEGSIANETLYKVLSRRYGISTNGAVDTITVPLNP